MESEIKKDLERKKIAYFCPQNWAKWAILGFWGPFGGPLWGIQGPNTPLVACHCVHFIILGAYNPLRTIPDVTWTWKKNMKKNFFRMPGRINFRSKSFFFDSIGLNTLKNHILDHWITS